MNITVYATAAAGTLRPGAVILDVPEAGDGDDRWEQIDKLPTAYNVDEVADRADGRTIYAFPAHRSDGPRRVWRVGRGDKLTVELTGSQALGVLEAITREAKAHRSTAAPMTVAAVLDSGGMDVQSLPDRLEVGDDA